MSPAFPQPRARAGLERLLNARDEAVRRVALSGLRKLDGETALRAALRGAQATLAIAPLILQERNPAELADGQSLSHNMLAPPYRTGGATYGYSMQDAVYCLGGFALEPGEALVISLTHPKCRFWNLTLWNQFMSAYQTEYSRSGINIGSAVPNSDGSMTIVISRELMAFRWFFADETPEQPTTAVVPVDQAPRTVS